MISELHVHPRRRGVPGNRRKVGGDRAWQPTAEQVGKNFRSPTPSVRKIGFFLSGAEELRLSRRLAGRRPAGRLRPGGACAGQEICGMTSESTVGGGWAESNGNNSLRADGQRLHTEQARARRPGTGQTRRRAAPPGGGGRLTPTRGLGPQVQTHRGRPGAQRRSRGSSRSTGPAQKGPGCRVARPAPARASVARRGCKPSVKHVGREREASRPENGRNRRVLAGS